MADRGGGTLREREHKQLKLQTSPQTSPQGGLYGSKEGWQDQEESPGEEESRWQEEEVGNTFIEAIH
ncbi:MAG TPA: hypothetical protein VN812_01210 [Candidatus Acidoferrales bacterium]|nr:hypothetical protein [Candidatus Acidoferrales bacterium]